MKSKDQTLLEEAYSAVARGYGSIDDPAKLDPFRPYATPAKIKRFFELPKKVQIKYLVNTAREMDKLGDEVSSGMDGRYASSDTYTAPLWSDYDDHGLNYFDELEVDDMLKMSPEQLDAFIDQRLSTGSPKGVFED
jgi:hypothetical protein